MTVTIYSLSDPISGEIRYVGKTARDLERRLNQHLAEKRFAHKRCWIESLLRKGLKPQIETLEIIENSDDKDWQEVERFWIAYLRFIGCSLTNADSGGLGGKCLSAETRFKISLANRGSVRTPEARAKMSAIKKGQTSPRKGVILSSETRKKIGLAGMGRIPWNKGILMTGVHPMLGKKHTAESLAKMSKSHLGFKHSDQSRKNMRGRIPWNKGRNDLPSSHMLGKTHTRESRAKISAALMGNTPWNKGKRGYKASDSTRAKMSASQKARFIT